MDLVDVLFGSTPKKIATSVALAIALTATGIGMHSCCESGKKKLLSEYETSPAVQYEKTGDFPILDRNPDNHSYLGLNSDISSRYDKVRRFQAIPSTIASTKSKANELSEVVQQAPNTKADNFVKRKLAKRIENASSRLNSLPSQDSYPGRYKFVLEQVELSSNELNRSNDYARFLRSNDNSDILGLIKETKYFLVIESKYTKRSKSDKQSDREIKDYYDVPVDIESFRRARINEKVDQNWADKVGVENAHQRRLTLYEKKEKPIYTAVSRKNFEGEKISESQYGHIKQVIDLLDIRTSRVVFPDKLAISIEEPLPHKVIEMPEVFH